MSRSVRNERGLVGWILLGAGVVVVAALALLLIAWTVNSLARWNAKRAGDATESTTQAPEATRDNVLLISAKEGEATGFLALRIDRDKGKVFGVAIPEGAFLEVPGQGFERIGDSYASGPDVSMSAISNFLSVPFDRYMVVSEEAYQAALRGQTMQGVVDAQAKTNISQADIEELAGLLEEIPSKNVALVPLEVKPITVGSQTYYEPQREALADLVESWWGVKLSEAEQAVRVIVYNGVGVPGVAGEAAQQLIRGGFRVVDTKNADNFDYTKTQIVVQNRDMTAGERVRKVLKTGKVVNQPADQDVADVIVIIGKDYKPPKSAGND